MALQKNPCGYLDPTLFHMAIVTSKVNTIEFEVRIKTLLKHHTMQTFFGEFKKIKLQVTDKNN